MEELSFGHQVVRLQSLELSKQIFLFHDELHHLLGNFVSNSLDDTIEFEAFVGLQFLYGFNQSLGRQQRLLLINVSQNTHAFSNK